jgi:thiol:disulfide interchange protein
MKLIALIEFLQKHLKQVRIISLSFLLLLVVSDWLFVDKSDAHTAPEHYIAFWAFFGFVSCVAIIFISKWYGHLGIMTREDYYDDDH